MFSSGLQQLQNSHYLKNQEHPSMHSNLNICPGEKKSETPLYDLFINVKSTQIVTNKVVKFTLLTHHLTLDRSQIFLIEQ